MVNGPGTVIFDRPVGIGAQEFDVAHFNGLLAANLADDARHRIWMAGPIELGAGIVDIDTLKRSNEAVIRPIKQ